MFDPAFSGDLPAALQGWPDRSLRMKHFNWVWLIWIVAGVVLAWTHSYITAGLAKIMLSALLAIVLWPLVLLGVSLHIH
jgi:hypothetical protein